MMTIGEKTIDEILRDIGVRYIREKSFHDLKGVGHRCLRYDFIVEGYILIEFDGRQHFQPVRFNNQPMWSAKKKFEKGVVHDKMKDAYAEVNGYPLLRIKYNQIKDVRSVVVEFLKNNI